MEPDTIDAATAPFCIQRNAVVKTTPALEPTQRVTLICPAWKRPLHGGGCSSALNSNNNLVYSCNNTDSMHTNLDDQPGVNEVSMVTQ